MLNFKSITQITSGKTLVFTEDRAVQHLLLDSRKIISPGNSLFFAIAGVRHNGHHYLHELYQKGVKQFIVELSAKIDPKDFPESNIYEVESSVTALQEIVATHRAGFKIPVIGITGSNGKTIVKEWLSQLLYKDFNIVKNPKSFNSQVGVPLSVWQMNGQHTLGIFEAGISLPEEMENLEKVIAPTLGIFTNVGTSHDEGFNSKTQKIQEKLKLFKKTGLLFFCQDHTELAEQIKLSFPSERLLCWSAKEPADLFVKKIRKKNNQSRVVFLYKNEKLNFILPFADEASIENIIHCILVLLYLKINHEEIQRRVAALTPVAMRLEIKEGINNCYVIDDSYNNDLAGLTMALNFLDQQKQKEKKSIILSDVLEAGMEEKELYQNIAGLLADKNIARLTGIGEVLSRNKNLFTVPSEFFKSTEEYIAQGEYKKSREEIILVKGARKFQFEKIIQKLIHKVHGTILEVNLDALSHNLNFYRSKLNPDTKIMVMVKAFAYGSGSFEVANILQFHRVDYLAVAYTDEGIVLRENGITLPVMVMNPSYETFDKMGQYNLETEIYSFKILAEFREHLKSNKTSAKIHLKIDTGMHRLGFEEKEIDQLLAKLKAISNIKVASVFTHLAGADEDVHNDFTKAQLTIFERIANKIENALGYKTIKHALNSAGIVSFPEAQFNMVRLGIGLYGVEASGKEQHGLQEVGTLKTIISQIKNIQAGESIGYSRKGKAQQNMRTATIAIGYADGYNRKFSNGKGKVLINGKLCPIIGNVCMDMSMVDISNVDAQEGDEVIVFGKGLPIGDLAKEIETIPYEILTSVSERVKRVFYSE